MGFSRLLVQTHDTTAREAATPTQDRTSGVNCSNVRKNLRFSMSRHPSRPLGSYANKPLSVIRGPRWPRIVQISFLNPLTHTLKALLNASRSSNATAATGAVLRLKPE